MTVVWRDRENRDAEKRKLFWEYDGSRFVCDRRADIVLNRRCNDGVISVLLNRRIYGLANIRIGRFSLANRADTAWRYFERLSNVDRKSEKLLVLLTVQVVPR